MPLAENLPSGAAQKPGDVIRFRNGKTVEVLNTDAEGRLVLADALRSPPRRSRDVIIDVATLTGACIIALGTEVAGAVRERSGARGRADRGRRATQGEPLWQLPLVPEYRDDLKSAVADLKNVGGGNAGSITGALFLQEFVGATRWAHLDVAGPAFADKDRPYIPTRRHRLRRPDADPLLAERRRHGRCRAGRTVREPADPPTSHPRRPAARAAAGSARPAAVDDAEPRRMARLTRAGQQA